MKVKWREHEFILATVVTTITIGICIRNSFNLTEGEIDALYADPFIRSNLPFNFYVNILIPQIAQYLLLYAAYLTAIKFIITTVRRLSLNELSVVVLKKVGWIVAKIIMVSYLLALGINIISYYAHPYLYNYGLAGFHILALFGYNDQPLTDLFAGFSRAFNLIVIATFFGGLREIIIYHIEKGAPGRAYRILVTNQITAILCIYFSLTPLVLDFAKPNLSGLLIIYFSFIPSSLLVFMGNTYWLFPLKGELSIFKPRILLRLLLLTFFCTAPFVLGHSKIKEIFFVYWSLQVLIITPLSWLFYQQKKDTILQLRGVEQQLVKTSTDLQFLRSQINPHFLFNTLNTLYGTALQEKSDRTAEGIQKLGDMMRFMLHENHRDFIPLRNEIEYLKNYISLQKLRTKSSDVHIEENLDDNIHDCDIAPMLLIPLVENAFKHGISLTAKSLIRIKLNCDDRYIHFEVRNSLHAKQHNNPEPEQSGIGLENVKERLKLIYVGKHQFYCGASSDEFIVQLSIQTTI